MARIAWVLAVLSAWLSLVSATASAPTFCKCTCFTNSTIIPLGPKSAHNNNGRSLLTAVEALPAFSAVFPRQGAGVAENHKPLAPRAGSASCSQCNRAFCLDYNLPICKGAEEKDVVTMCFQRDSRKDQIIVWCFLLGTLGLLGWAAVKHVVEARQAAAVAAAERTEAPLLGGGRGAVGEAGSNTSSGGFLGLLRRAAASVRGGSSGGGGGGLLDPRSQEASRGQYSPLGGSHAG